MSDEPEINIQCYICPWCFNDHFGEACLTKDVKEHVERLQSKVTDLEAKLKVAKSIKTFVTTASVKDLREIYGQDEYRNKFVNDRIKVEVIRARDLEKQFGEDV